MEERLLKGCKKTYVHFDFDISLICGSKIPYTIKKMKKGQRLLCESCKIKLKQHRKTMEFAFESNKEEVKKE